MNTGKKIMQNSNVVIDTNVYISALIFGNIPEKVTNYCQNYLNVFISIDIINEIQKVLIKKFLFNNEELKEILSVIITPANIVVPKIKINIFKNSGDNKILKCAVESESRYVISGDKKHLLKLRTYKGIKIVSPAEFYNLDI